MINHQENSTYNKTSDLQEFKIRSFNDSNDIDFACEITRREKWHSESKIDLLSFFEYDRKGCFIAELNGEKAGICIATAYKKNGFIGELIVSPIFRKNGIGTALLQRSIQFLKGKNIQKIYLDGVESAIPLYKKIGFLEIYRSLRLFGEIEPSISPIVSEINNNDLQEILAIDRSCFAEDRSFFLLKRFENFPGLGLKLVRDNSIQAYLFGRVGNGGWITVGPVVNLSKIDYTILLLKSFQERIGYQPFSIGILEHQKDLVIQLIQCGLKPEPNPPMRMILGNAIGCFENDQCHAIGSPAKG